jgi:hypothetical protein
MESGMGLHSGKTNEKRLISAVASKPYSSLGGFDVSSLSLLATFGKRLAGHYLPHKQRCDFCNVDLYRTFAWVSNLVRVSLEGFSTFGLRPHRKRRVGHVANISQCHIIVSITKYATSGKVKRGRGLELSHLYRATAYRIEIVSEVFVF